MNKITTSGLTFRDEHGRERIFSGFNIVDKQNYGEDGKFEFSFKIDDDFFKKYKERGFNIIRLGFSWDPIEPKPGQYNEKLLDDIERVVDECAKHGIFVFLDVHQDCYSTHCHNAGNGAPLWASLMDQYKQTKMKFVWAEGYFFSKSVHRAFDNFWTNKEFEGKGIQDRYADLWVKLAQRFKDKPNLFGFDFMNEPYPGKDGGKLFKKLILNLVKVTLTDKRVKKWQLIKDGLSKDRKVQVLDQYPADVFTKIIMVGNDIIKKFDTERYSPFLNRMAKSVRGVTDEGILFVDNCYYSNLGIPCYNLPIEVDGKREAKQCFSPHGYDLMVDTPAYKYANNGRVGALFAEHRRTQERLGVPCLVGEWGGNAEGTEWLPHVEFLLDTFAGYKWSNTYWAYYDGILEMPLMDVLGRPYPKAVTGDIVDYVHDREADTFTLRYKQEGDFEVPTVIFANKDVKSVTINGQEQKVSTKAGEDIELFTKAGENEVVVSF
ncbi:MAG: cellulase family glycosylhydrolase [Clostridiales bacterium]|nr:cellulase family glycosylhydrolase [Clostridiales bacterium]